MSDQSLPSDFCSETYLTLNPDVETAGCDPIEHYLTFGKAEERSYKYGDHLPEDFSPEEYLRLNPDVLEAGINPTQHYVQHGKAEKRFYHLNRSDETPHIEDGIAFDYDGLTSVHNHDFMEQKHFQTSYFRGVEAGGADYKCYWRAHIAIWAAQTAARVDGAFVECGVNKGFMSSAIMQALDWNDLDRTFYLLDTFEGLTDDAIASEELSKRNKNFIDSGFYTTSVTPVIENFDQWQGVKIIQGAVPGTLTQIDTDKIAFLHIDMNCPEPEVAALDLLWKRLSIGGIVLLDDYAYVGYLSQKQAMDTWASVNNVFIASLPTGQGLLIKN